MSERNKIDSYFRDRLAGFEQSPPESSWENITRKLGERRKRRVFLLVFRIAAGMAILLSTGFGVYLVTRHKEVPPAAVSVNKTMDRNNQSESESAFKAESHDIADNKELSRTQKNADGKQNNVEGTQRNIKGIQQNSATEETQNTEPLNNNLYADEQIIQESGAPQTKDHDNLTALNSIDGRPVNNPAALKLQEKMLTPEEAAALLLADYAGDFEDSDNEISGHHWSLGSEVAPLYSYRAITSYEIPQSSISKFNASESGVLAYAGGLRINYSTGKRFTVQSGIYYSRYGQQKEASAVSTNSMTSENYSFVQVTNSTGRIRGVVDGKASYYSPNNQGDPVLDNFTNTNYKNGIANADIYPVVRGNASDLSFEQLFDYFEIPVIMKYKIIDRRMDFSLNGGLVTNLLFGNSINMVTDGKTTKITETTEINKINYLGSFGLGVDYPVSDRFDITLEPRFRYYINPIGTSSEIVVHPYSFGFFAGFNYRF